MNLKLVVKYGKETERILINIYQKIGSIAQQIEALRNLDPEKPHNVIGGYRIENKEEFEQLIDYQWNRLYFLQTLAKQPDYIDQTLREFNALIISCDDCSTPAVCDKHFFTNSYIKLLELIKT